MNTSNYDICSKSMTKIARYRKDLKSGLHSKSPNWECVGGGSERASSIMIRAALWSERPIMRTLRRICTNLVKKLLKLPNRQCI